MAEATTPAGAPTPEQIEAAALAESRLAALRSLGDVNQANAATGIYGDSGSGKSTLAATAVEYCWQRYHRIGHYYTADPGGFGNKLIRLIRLGIVKVYNPTNHVEPFETMENISKGWWPETILDPFTGYAAPDVKLIPPQRTEYVVFCPKGHEVVRTGTQKTLNGFSRVCPTCKGAPVTSQTWSKVEEQIIRAPGFEHVGINVFDSGTSLGDHAMEDMAGRAAAADPSIKDGNALTGTGARLISGAYAFGASTQQHYGFAQNAMRRWIKNSRLIPGQVMPPIWTFLTQRGESENSSASILGPKIPGNAKTSEVPAWLGNCLHAEIIQEQNVRKHRLWLVNHFMPGTSVPYLAKTRTEPGDLPTYLEDQPNEPIFTRFSLGYFFNEQELALEKHALQDIQDFPDAPAFNALQESAATVVSTRDMGASAIPVGPTVGRAAVTAPGASAPRPAATVAPTTGRPATPQAPVPPAVAPAAAPAAKPATPPAAAAPKPVAAAPTPKPVPGSAAAPVPAPVARVAPQAAGAPVAPVAPAPPAGRPPTPAINPNARRAMPPPAGRAPGTAAPTAHATPAATAPTNSTATTTKQ